MRSFHRNLLLGVLALLLLFPMPAFSASSTVNVTVDETLTDYDALTRNNLVFMPARDLANLFNAKLAYNADSRELTLKSTGCVAKLRVGSSAVIVNGEALSMDASPMIVDDTCYVSLKAAKLIWGASYGCNEAMLYIHTDGSDVLVPVIEKYTVETATISIDGKKSELTYLSIAPNSGLSPNLVLAQNTVGSTEVLSSIAKRSSARCAINGNPYQSFGSDETEPYGLLIKNGALIHSAGIGSAVGFAADGTVKMDTVRTNITATVGGNSYSVNMMNHTPSATANSTVLFTRAYGSSLDLSIGTCVVVQDGEVIQIANKEAVSIPVNGYVLLFTGSNVQQAKILQTGDKASYKVSYVNGTGAAVNWQDVQTAAGAGAMLLKNGSVVVNPEAEGFTNLADFSVSINRSAVGVTKDGTILLVGGVKCTLEQLADVMTSLGAVNAISMDSGTTSGLYASSDDVPTATKAVSSAIIFK